MQCSGIKHLSGARASGGKHKIERIMLFGLSQHCSDIGIFDQFVRLGTHAFHAVLSKKAVTIRLCLGTLPLNSLCRVIDNQELFRAWSKKAYYQWFRYCFDCCKPVAYDALRDVVADICLHPTLGSTTMQILYSPSLISST